MPISVLSEPQSLYLESLYIMKWKISKSLYPGLLHDSVSGGQWPVSVPGPGSWSHHPPSVLFSFLNSHLPLCLPCRYMYYKRFRFNAKQWGLQVTMIVCHNICVPWQCPCVPAMWRDGLPSPVLPYQRWWSMSVMITQLPMTAQLVRKQSVLIFMKDHGLSAFSSLVTLLDVWQVDMLTRRLVAEKCF